MNSRPAQSVRRRPQLGVSVALRRGGAFLLVRRAREPQAGFWTFPGGCVEYGETLREAARRELFEETAVVAEIGDQLGLYDLIGRAAPGLPASYHSVLIVFAGTYVSGEPRAGDDAAEAAWFAPAEVGSLRLTAETGELILGLQSG